MSKYITMKIPAPRVQGAAILVLAAVMIVGGGTVAKSPLFPWLASGACMLLFVVFNNAISIFSDHFGKYFQESMMVMVAVLLAMGAMAWLVSGQSIHDAEPYRTIYIVLIMAYFSLAAMCFLVRAVIEYLLNKDR